jgi:spore germination protein
MQIHVVKHGDTLWQLARQYHVSTDRIAQANNLPDPNKLVVGQALVVPTSDEVHIVQSGESLWMLAKRYRTTVQQLMQINQISNPSHITPGWVLRIPAQAKPVIVTNGYITTTGEPGAAIVRDVGKFLTYLSPFSYRVREDGRLTPLDDTALLQAARAKQVAPLLTITNFKEEKFDSDVAHAVLANKEVQEKLLNHILNTMKEKGYKGLNIDFEYIYREDRLLYNQFIRRVKEKLHPEGYVITSALAPKTSGTQPGLLYEAHDYAVHGEVLDFVILMTYEWGYVAGPAMAVSPIDQIKKVLDYAVTVIPPHKILMGVSIYGYDWTLPYVKGSLAKTIAPNEAIRIALQYGAAIQYDPTAQAPFFHYFDKNHREHEVWFEDARSIQAKMDVVKQYGLLGVSYWVLGSSPFNQNWWVLQHNFNKLAQEVSRFYKR